jgi:hypothetical protein
MQVQTISIQSIDIASFLRLNKAQVICLYLYYDESILIFFIGLKIFLSVGFISSASTISWNVFQRQFLVDR